VTRTSTGTSLRTILPVVKDGAARVTRTSTGTSVRTILPVVKEQHVLTVPKFVFHQRREINDDVKYFAYDLVNSLC